MARLECGMWGRQLIYLSIWTFFNRNLHYEVLRKSENYFFILIFHHRVMSLARELDIGQLISNALEHNSHPMDYQYLEKNSGKAEKLQIIYKGSLLPRVNGFR